MPRPYIIPPRSKYIPTANVFEATFNTPTISKYDFNVAGNTKQHIIDLQPNALYLLDRISTSANISEQDFTASLNVNPTFDLFRKIKSQREHPKPIPVINFTDNQDLIIWSYTQKKNDSLVADFRGVLDQIPALVGVTSIKITVSLSIYEIENTEYIKQFLGDVSANMGDQIRGVKWETL